jgi:uncharacterized protein YeaO (DUF488 family)
MTPNSTQNQGVHPHKQPQVYETYLAIKKRMQKQFPNAHFEVVTRTAGSPLAPSEGLLKNYKQKVEEQHAKFKKSGFSFSKNEIARPIFEVYYKPRYLLEQHNSLEANIRIGELLHILDEQDIFVVCYEKDVKVCHRRFVQGILQSKMNFNELDQTLYYEGKPIKIY